MPTLVRKIVRRTLIAKAVIVLLIVLVIGGSQVLLRQLPAHKDDVQAWVANELGLELQFARLEAGWSWRGPELEFGDASVRALGAAAPFVTARAANVGFNPLRLAFQLLTRREVGVDRLTFEGTELTLVKTETGDYRLQGAPATAAGREETSFQVPPDIDVLVRDSRVLYLDPARSIAWSFQDVTGSMRRDGDVLKVEASAKPPREFANRIDLTVQAVITTDKASPGARFTGDWRLSADVDEVDIAAASLLLPPMALAPRSGRGDGALRLEWQAKQLVGGNVDLKLADVSLPSGPGYSDPRFERIALHGDWERDGDAWHVAFKDLSVTHATRAWPVDGDLSVDVVLGDDVVQRLTVHGNFIRLEDVTPFITPLPQSEWRDLWIALAPRGDVRDFDLGFGKDADARPEYTVAGKFAGLGALPYQSWPGITSLAGEVHADARSGRLELDTTGVALDWPGMFRSRLEADVKGLVVWRAGQDAVRVVSDDLVVGTRDATLRTNLELTLPMDGSSPRLDLRTAVSSFDVLVAPRYFPVGVMPTSVVEWLDAGLRGGRADNAEVTFVGPLRAFPFDGGEGEFRATVQVDQAQLAFVADWPVAEDLHGTVEFVNARFAAHGSGRILGNHTDEVRVAIADLRTGELTVAADTTGKLDQVLAFLNKAPLIANYLGDRFARLEAPAGDAQVNFDLMLPLRDPKTYRLTAGIKVKDGELAFRGFAPHATELDGKLALAGGKLKGEGIKGIFLDGPVTLDVQTVDMPGYRARVNFEGEVPVDAVVQAFSLPQGDRLAGQTSWRGSLLIPAAAEGKVTAPGRITIDSNLAGVALRFPEPFAKSPGEPTNLQVEMSFPERGMEMRGNVGPARRFALDFDTDPKAEGRFVFRRAALRFGGALPDFRADQGVTLDGAVPVLHVDEWMALSGSGGGSASMKSHWSEAFSGADLDVADFYVFGQQLGSSKVSARRRTDDWQFEIDSNAIAGTILVPMDLAKDPQVVAVMKRLYLNAGSGGAPSQNKLDPRELPGVQLHADAFGFGQRQLGRLDAEILSDPLGLRLVSFESATDAFTAQGTGGWFVNADGIDGDTTRLAATVTSTNVGKMLDQLGFSNFLVAESGEVTASVHWPGPPSGAWLDHIAGDLSLKTKKGSLIDVEPGGAGRFAGLLSFGALPRRLAFDFRDVFNKGFVFDEITADFVLVDGNAYTDNLKLTGPVADVGMVGRTGLRDHDYRQQAIVTAEPTKMLPTVGALIAGPAGAAALFIFQKIFKKPLSGLGRAAYCVSGTWAEPMVEKLTDEEAQKGAPCAELPPGGLGQRQGVAQR